MNSTNGYVFILLHGERNIKEDLLKIPSSLDVSYYMAAAPGIMNSISDEYPFNPLPIITYITQHIANMGITPETTDDVIRHLTQFTINMDNPDYKQERNKKWFTKNIQPLSDEDQYKQDVVASNTMYTYKSGRHRFYEHATKIPNKIYNVFPSEHESTIVPTVMLWMDDNPINILQDAILSKVNTVPGVVTNGDVIYTYLSYIIQYIRTTYGITTMTIFDLACDMFIKQNPTTNVVTNQNTRTREGRHRARQLTTMPHTIYIPTPSGKITKHKYTVGGKKRKHRSKRIRH